MLNSGQRFLFNAPVAVDLSGRRDLPDGARLQPARRRGRRGARPERPTTVSTDPADRPIVSVSDLHFSYLRGGAVVAALRGVSIAVQPGEAVGAGRRIRIGEVDAGARRCWACTPPRLSRIDAGRIVIDGQDVTALRAEAMGVAARPSGGDGVPGSAELPQPGDAGRPPDRRERAPPRSAAPTSARECASCSISCGCRRASRSPIRTSSRAACASARCSPSRSAAGPGSWSPTSRRPRSTSRRRPRSWPCCADLRQRLGMAMLLISHDLGLVASACERIYVMYAGRTVEWGATAERVQRRRRIRTRWGCCNRRGRRPQRRRPLRDHRRRRAEPRPADRRAARSVRAARSRSSRASRCRSRSTCPAIATTRFGAGSSKSSCAPLRRLRVSSDEQPLLELRQVSKTFRSAAGETVHAVRAVSLDGPSAARPSRWSARAVPESRPSVGSRSGLIEPDSGDVLLDGRSFAEPLARGRSASARIAMQPIFQDATASLNPRRTVRQLHGAGACAGTGAASDSHAAALLDSVGLRPGARIPRPLPARAERRPAAAPGDCARARGRAGAHRRRRAALGRRRLDPRPGPQPPARHQGGTRHRLPHDHARHLDRASLRRPRRRHAARARSSRAARSNDVLVAPRHDYTRRLLAAVRGLDISAP